MIDKKFHSNRFETWIVSIQHYNNAIMSHLKAKKYKMLYLEIGKFTYHYLCENKYLT